MRVAPGRPRAPDLLESTGKSFQLDELESTGQIAQLDERSSHPTVAGVRRDLEDAGDVETLSTWTDSTLTSRPRTFVRHVRASVQEIGAWIVLAVKGRAWLALGYASWDAHV